MKIISKMTYNVTSGTGMLNSTQFNLVLNTLIVKIQLCGGRCVAVLQHVLVQRNKPRERRLHSCWTRCQVRQNCQTVPARTLSCQQQPVVIAWIMHWQVGVIYQLTKLYSVIIGVMHITQQMWNLRDKNDNKKAQLLPITPGPPSDACGSTVQFKRQQRMNIDWDD